MKNLYESFKYFVAVEMMEGENKYHAEGYGLQDAKKGFVFESFPPVLHLQLKRFEYDIHRDAMVKVRFATNIVFTLYSTLCLERLTIVTNSLLRLTLENLSTKVRPNLRIGYTSCMASWCIPVT